MKVRYVYLKRLYINVLIISILFSASTIISPMMSAQLVDGVVRTVDDWLWLLILFIISYMIQILLSTLDYWQKGWFSAKEKRIMRQEIFQAALKKGRISRKENANIVSFVNNHVASIVQSIYIGEIGIVQCFSLILFSVLALIYLHWLFAMIILGDDRLIEQTFVSQAK